MRMTHLWTQAPNLNGASDKTVAVIKFESLSGEPIAAYMTYAMHPVNGYLSEVVSADFCGAASRYVEQAFDDKLVAVSRRARRAIRIRSTCAPAPMSWRRAAASRSPATC